MSHPYYAGILEALKAEKAGPSVWVLTDGRIFSDQLPKDPELPGVRVAILTDYPSQRLRHAEATTADIQIDVYAHRADSATAWEIDRQARKTLDRKAVLVGGMPAEIMCLARGRPMQEPPFYRVTSRYRLFGNKS